MSQLNNIGRKLAHALAVQKAQAKELEAQRALEEKVNVVGAGGALTAAYEQLRNAAENTEEHLLLQNAIKRFYKQLFLTRDEDLVASSGSELAIELTLAGYVANDSLTRTQLNQISQLANNYYQAYKILHKNRRIHMDKLSPWVLDTLAVEVELVLSDHHKDAAFIEVANDYFSSVLTPQSVFNKTRVEDFAAGLYVAIYKALLKSNEGTIRAMLLRRYGVRVDNLENFVSLNKQIDRLLESKTAKTLYRVVDKQGAPLRILRRMIEDKSDIEKILEKRDTFLEEYERQVNLEYRKVGKRINRAIVRSVIFLIITKFLIGIAIEVPYDFWAHGHIVWLPLVINLLFPPVYMVLLRLTHALPTYANTVALVDRIDAMLYGERQILMKKQIIDKKYGSFFSIVYGITSLAVFALVVWILLSLQFSLVHIVIFFIFISAASFLGFRLSHLIRELEVVHSDQNGITFIRDLLYLPFVVIGRWMSDKYAKANIVTIVLDMLIELPLKTVLRLVRQWAAFIDERKDHLT